jgi:hypothetical protein
MRKLNGPGVAADIPRYRPDCLPHEWAQRGRGLTAAFEDGHRCPKDRIVARCRNPGQARRICAATASVPIDMRGRPRIALRHASVPPVAVGTRIAPPRTDPDVQLSRIRLLPRVPDGKPLVAPWMKYARPGKPVIRQHGNAGSGQASLLAAPAERLAPKSGDTVPERDQRAAIGRHSVVSKVAGDHLFEPFPLFGNQPSNLTSGNVLTMHAGLLG